MGLPPVEIWVYHLCNCSRLREFALPSSTCLIKTVLEVCTEHSGAPLDAGWYGGTHVNLAPFSASRIERTLRMLTAACCPKPPLLAFRSMQTTSAKPRWFSSWSWNPWESPPNSWNRHQQQSRNSTCPSQRNQCGYAPMA